MSVCVSVNSVSVVCCQVEISATGRSLIQRSPTDFLSDLETLTVRNSRLSRAVQQ
jgi:hypothetical protein